MRAVAYPVCVHLRSVCMCACTCLCAVFVLLKGLAQSRPFVVGSGGHGAQLVWFMDASQSCISLRTERGCPSSSWCETPINVPTTDGIKQKLIRASNRSDTHIVLSVYQYIDNTRKETGAQMKHQRGTAGLGGRLHATAAGDMS